MSDLDVENGLEGDDKIIAEAKRRFTQCEAWEKDFRTLFLEDLKFANADSDNHYQWPNQIRQDRQVDSRPILTINKTRQHNLQIINDSKQNTPSIKVHAMGDGATYQAAQVFEGIMRHIEYISHADVAYDTATTFQVEAGIGYFRVVTDYVGDDTFDQEIYIRRIKDPLTIYLDPDIDELDGSDARFAFVFDSMPRDEFEKAYPKYKDKAGQVALDNGDTWINKDHIRVAEYFRKVSKTDKLLSFTDPTTGQMLTKRASKIPEDLKKTIIDDPETQHRIINDDQIEWFLIIGDEVAEKREWLGKYIPIVRVIGEETIIEGILDRKGHTRALKDPQRMYNYFSSAAVEQVALQSKSPYITPAQAIEGNETYWASANTVNHAILPYNHRDDDGNEIPMPQRAEPPVSSTGYLQAMQTAQAEMMMVSGQYEANFGQKSNERSGKAIDERQRQGDTATYHFIDNLAIAIRYCGRIVLDLIPKIYDTPRILRILAEDGEPTAVELDPNAMQSYFEVAKAHGDQVRRIFNPNVGRYEVEVDVGPGYATKREEAFNAFSQIAAQNPALMNIVGDLLFKSADFPGAEDLAERLRRMVPPQALGEGPSAQEQALTAQLQQAQGMMTKLMQQLSEERLKLKGKEQQKDIDVYKAITDRLKTLLPTILNPKDIAVMVHDLMVQEQQAQLQQVTAASAPVLEQSAAQQGVNNGQQIQQGGMQQ